MDVVSTLSSTGRTVNEDFIHLQPNRWAMLLDGSSGLMPNVLVPHLQGRFQSDAQWFVHTFAHAFAQVEQPSTPLPTAVEQALALVEQQYLAIPIADHLRGFAYEPSASLAIFRNTQESGPELFLLGDCTAIWDGGVYHDPAVSRLDDRAIQLCMHLSDTTGNRLPKSSKAPPCGQSFWSTGKRKTIRNSRMAIACWPLTPGWPSTAPTSLCLGKGYTMSF